MDDGTEQGPDGSSDEEEAKRAVEVETSAAEHAADDQHQDRGQVRTLRGNFSWLIPALVFLWMVAIYALLLFEGTKRFFRLPFELPNEVMLAALATVTLNVIGLLVIVLKFVFQESPRGDSK